MANNRQTLRPTATIKLKTNLRGVLKLHEALRILSMPAADLRETIQGYLASNPILEEEQPKPTEPEYSDDHRPGLEIPKSRIETEDMFSIEQVKSHDKSLREILMEEPQLTFDDPDMNELKEYLVGNIDDDGYLLCTVEEAADYVGTTPEMAEDVLRHIQDAAPPGIGARDPQEALLLQIRHDISDGEEREIAQALVSEYYQQLKKRRYGEVANRLGTSADNIYRIWDRISRYSLSPGANYAKKADYVTPEIQVRILGDQIQVSPLKDGIPNIMINQEYVSILKETKNDQETATYLKDKMYEAKWLIRAIDQRKQNIMRIVTEVTRVQSEFFKNGENHIKPLTLKDVAEKLRLAPSTVSRAINSKYMLTQKGTFPLKHFFTSGFSNGKIRISNHAVKDIVKEYCDEGCYTDKEIADMIGRRLSIKLSRRAVAQYRSEMNIPSSLDRKKRLRE